MFVHPFVKITLGFAYEIWSLQGIEYMPAWEVIMFVRLEMLVKLLMICDVFV